ncbi:Molybdopterin synthase catalytic subunit [Kappamyces sp. JEL0829]|nr:Molybdopterin synthase catalytic subunit [Kappamyces sp. JEL0829]KAJ3367312.1 Molybdopterin synthase catalytic subunit [Kappamyces sp. JEL0680]
MEKVEQTTKYRDCLVAIGIQEDVLDQQALVHRLTFPSCGAVVSFIGTTREMEKSVGQDSGPVVTHLSYEAYVPMAIKVMTQIAHQAKDTYAGLAGVGMYHRLGNVPVMATSIQIVTCSPHRGDAIAAIGWIMDQFKAKVPIWKKEHYKQLEPVWKSNPEAL